MAFDYGSTLEPGIVTDVESALTVVANTAAPADVGLIGQADLVNGSASTDTVYQITNAPDARDYFGDDSELTDVVIDAIEEDAYPIYAVAPSEISVTGEDLSGLTSHTGTVANGPVTRNASDVVFTINGSTLTTVIDYGDVFNKTPDTGEVLVNPSTREFHIDNGATVGNTGDAVDYIHLDYATAHDAMVSDAGEAIDFLTPVSEATTVTDDAQTTVGNMANDHNFALSLIGADPYINDKTNYTVGYDDSRVQAIYPTRDDQGYSTLGSFAGFRASIGIKTSPINKRLDTQKNLSEGLSLTERGDLIDNRVVPLDQEAAGARIADDVNTVSDSNTEEANIRFGFTRLVVDYVLATVRISERPFIGRLNSYPVRKALEGLIRNELKKLTRSNAVIDYHVQVSKIDATSAALSLKVNTAEPLRFIENTVTIGN